jgi:hypothetical protein
MNSCIQAGWSGCCGLAPRPDGAMAAGHKGLGASQGRHPCGAWPV